MRIDETEAKRRLSSSRNIADLGRKQDSSIRPLDSPSSSQETGSNITHEEIIRGRHTGSRNVPEPVRDLMASMVIDGASAASVGRALGVSGDVAERSATGRVGGRPANADRLSKIKERKLDIQDSALVKLMRSLELIDDDKLLECSAKELSGISSNLAKVHSTLEEKSDGGAGNNVNIVVFAPQQKREDRYKVVDV